MLVYTSLQIPSIKAKLKAITYGSPQVRVQAPYFKTKKQGKGKEEVCLLTLDANANR